MTHSNTRAIRPSRADSTGPRQAERKQTTFLIEIAERDAGLAIMEGDGARFIASDPQFQQLDNRRFPNLGHLVRAAESMDAKARADRKRRPEAAMGSNG